MKTERTVEKEFLFPNGRVIATIEGRDRIWFEFIPELPWMKRFLIYVDVQAQDLADFFCRFASEYSLHVGTTLFEWETLISWTFKNCNANAANI